MYPLTLTNQPYSVSQIISKRVTIYCLVYHGTVILSLGLQAAVTTFACDRAGEEAMPAEVERELQG